MARTGTQAWGPSPWVTSRSPAPLPPWYDQLPRQLRAMGVQVEELSWTGRDSLHGWPVSPACCCGSG